jgi:hypothetical protein
MDSGGLIAMDSGSGNRQRRRNGRQDGKVITMGDGTAVEQWMAQWVEDNCQRVKGQNGTNACFLVGC